MRSSNRNNLAGFPPHARPVPAASYLYVRSGASAAPRRVRVRLVNWFAALDPSKRPQANPASVFARSDSRCLRKVHALLSIVHAIQPSCLLLSCFPGPFDTLDGHPIVPLIVVALKQINADHNICVFDPSFHSAASLLPHRLLDFQAKPESEGPSRHSRAP